nr:4Fe-4S binding protein [uncultured Sphaerochaeta sp.]
MQKNKIRKTCSLISMLLFPITINYLSPYLIIQGSFFGIVSGSFLVFVSLFITSLIFGRAFCSWFCPAGGIQSVARTIQDKKTKPRMNKIKYIIWIPWVLTIIIGFITAGGIHEINPIFMTDYGISVSSIYNYLIYLPVVTLILIPSLFVGKHAFCHSLCWISPWMVLGCKLKEQTKFASYRLVANKEACISCKKCSSVCPMSIEVMDLVRQEKGMYHSECILCGECVQACPKDVLQLKIARPQ